MKKKFDLERINRIFTVFLCLTMFMNFLPIGVWAEENSNLNPSDVTETLGSNVDGDPETATVNKSISTFNIFDYATDYKQKILSTITLDVRATYSIDTKNNSEVDDSVSVGYEFYIPKQIDGGGLLSFTNYNWLDNAKVSTVIIDQKPYWMLTGTKLYQDIVAGGSGEKLQITNTVGGEDGTVSYDGQTYNVHSIMWIEGDKEHTEKENNTLITMQADFDKLYDATLGGDIRNSYIGYYDKDTMTYYDLNESHSNNAVKGRFLWIVSLINKTQKDAEPLKGLQNWNVHFSVLNKTKTSIEQETREDYKPIFIDYTDSKSKLGVLFKKSLDYGGNAVYQYGGASSSVNYSGEIIDKHSHIKCIADVERTQPDLFVQGYLFFIPDGPSDEDINQRIFNISIDNISLHSASGKDTTESNLNNNNLQINLPDNKVSTTAREWDKRVHFNVHNSVSRFPTSSSIGSKVTMLMGIRPNFADTSSLNINALNLFVKWDDKGLTLNTNEPINTYSGDSLFFGKNKQINILYAAKKNGEGWVSNEEILKTKATDEEVIFYDSMEQLLADGKKCIGVLKEYREGRLILTTYGLMGMRLIPFIVTGNINSSYMVAFDYEAWYGDNVLSGLETYKGTNGGTKPLYTTPPNLYDYSYDQEGDSYQFDDWQEENGKISSDPKNHIDADTIHVVGYDLSTNKASVINNAKNTSPATFDISKNERVAAIKSDFAVNWKGNTEDPKNVIHFSVDLMANQLNDVTWSKISSIGKVFIANSEAKVFWDENKQTFYSDDPSFREINSDDFYVQGGGKYSIYHSYFLGNIEDISKDIDVKEYILASEITCLSREKCAQPKNTYDESIRTKVAITKSGTINVYKNTRDSVVDIGSDFTYMLSSSTNGERNGEYFMLDILPFNNDFRGSHFIGDLSLKDKKIHIKLTTKNANLLSNFRFYYTTSSGVQNEFTSLPKNFDKNNYLGVAWKEGRTEVVNESTTKKEIDYYLENVDSIPTAILVRGDFEADERIFIELKLSPNGENINSTYINRGKVTSENYDYRLINSPNVTISTPSKSISGTAWADANGDGVKDADESVLSGIQVRLYDDKGNEITKDANGNNYGTVMTDSNGQYTFMNPADYEGKFYVQYLLSTEQAKLYGLTKESGDNAFKSTVKLNPNSEDSPVVKNATDLFSMDTYATLAENNQADLVMNKHLGLLPKYEVTWRAGDNGTITPSSPSEMVLSNQSPTTTVTPQAKNDYHFTGKWLMEVQTNGKWENKGLIADYKTTKITAPTRFTAQFTGLPTLEVKGQKHLTGGGKTDSDIAAEQFSFNVTRTDQESGTVTVTGLPTSAVKVQTGGALDFGTWKFSQEGTYTFTLSENDVPTGYTKATDIAMKVVVAKDDDGVYTAQATYNGENQLVFTNHYTSPDSIKVTLQGTKQLTENGQAKLFTDGQFQAKIAADDENDTSGYTDLNSKIIGIPADGRFSFEPITFKKAGIYRFVITEINSNQVGYVYDHLAVEATVKVTLDEVTNKLSANITYKKNTKKIDQILFNNIFISPSPAKVTLTGMKYLTENNQTLSLAKNQFQFTIQPDANNPKDGLIGLTSTQVGNEENGSFNFETFSLTKVGTYKFVISEVDGQKAGYTYDKKPVTAIVKVRLATDNTLVPTVTYTKDNKTVESIAFTNQYATPTATDVTFTGTKKLTENNQAKAFTAGQFQAKIVADSANDATGYTGFTNAETIDIPANGNFSFDPIHFNKVGTYRFAISEVNGQATGYTYDGLVVEATVKVSLDQATNKLVSAVAYKKNGETVEKAVFNNTYTAPKATKVTFTGTKVLKEGNSVKAFTAGQFQAKIAADSANDTTGYTGFTSKTIDIPSNGTFNFDAITFTKAGTYTFTISEVNGQKAGYTYDAKPVTATVKVTLDADNVLKPTVTYKKDGQTVQGIAFNNTYTTPTAIDVTLQGTKKLTENNQAKAFTAGQFQAKIVADSANDATGYTGFTNAETIDIPANGNFSFDPIHFNKVGTYRFAISEVNGQATGYTYDSLVVEATVKVSLDQETNKLVSAVTYKKNGETVEKAVFNNMYIAPKATKVTFTGTKVLKEGNSVKAFTAGQFQAKIAADSANDTTGYTGFTSKTIDIPANGTFNFDAITFTKAGTYTFTISEVNGQKAGYTYDAKPVTAKVMVTLGSDNTLVPSVTYTKDNKTVESIVFTNQYATPTATDVTFTGTKKLTENNQAKAFTAGQFQAKIVADSTNDATGYTGFTNAEMIDIPANGNFSFDPIHFNKVGTYRFILTEVNGAKAGYTYDAMAIEAIVKVDLDQTTNKLTSTVTYKKNSQVVNQAVFNNTYTTPSPSAVTLTGTKTLTENEQAKVMTKDQFQFTVTPDKDNPEEGYTGLTTTTVGNEANGSFSFGTLNFTKVGTYKFVINEVDGKQAGYTYDDKLVNVTVKVTLGEDNVLHPTVTYEKAGQTVQGIAFNNTYTTPAAIDVTLQGTKKLTENNQAKAFTAGQFQAKIVADSTNDATGYTGFSNEKMIGIPANGNFSFDSIHFNKVGTYRFTISEVNGQATGYTYDGQVVEATVKVSLDQATNKLTSAVTYKKNGQAIEQAVFNNTYTAPSPTTITLTGTKILTENAQAKVMTKDQFHFTVTPDKDNPADGYTGLTTTTVGNEANGSFSFGALNFTKAGTYKFVINEVDGKQAGYTYDVKSVTATVTVKLATDNTLVPTVTYTKNSKRVESIAFTNQYATPTATDVTLTGTKILKEGETAKAFTTGQFKANIVADSTNDTTGYTGFTSKTIHIPANGTFSFDSIHFTKAGTYHFTISEVNGQATGYTYDNLVVEATVKVSLDKATNKLVSTVTYKKNGQAIEQAVFNNTYTAPSPTTITLMGTKVLKEGDTAKAFTAGQFQFTVTPDKDNPADGYTGLATTTVGNEANGSFSFGTLNFTKVGTYKFVISEVDGQKAGYTYDDKPVTATVKVTLGEDNVLHPTVTYEKDGQSAEAIAFTNTYTMPSAVSLHLTAQKELTGQKDTKSIQANQFHFTVSGDRNRKVGVQAGGTIDFGTFSFTQVGNYRMTIQEENLGQAGYTYDTSRYDWLVTVTLNEATNRLEATSQLTKDGQAVSAVTFTNHYQAKSVVVADPPIEKAVIGQPTTPAAFSFVMTATNPTFPMPTGSVNGEKTMTRIGAGRVEFGDITFTETGTYTYVLQEKNLATPGYAYDQRSYLVTYEVTDKDGQLTVTRTIEQAVQTVTRVLFTNVYTAPILPNTGGNPSEQNPGESSTNTQSTNPTAQSLLPNTGTNPTVSKVVQQPTPTTNRLPKTGNASSAAYVWVGIVMIVLSGMSCLLYYRNHRKMNRP